MHAEFRSVEPGKFVTAVVGHLTEVGMRQEGGRRGARLRDGALAEQTRPATLPLVQRIVAFYEQRFGPCPYHSLGIVVAEAETPGGHSPPGLVYLQQRPPVLRAAVAARRPGQLLGPARLLRRTRGRSPVVGAGDRPVELPRAVAVGGVGAVRGRALGAREPRRGGLPLDDGPHGAVGVRARRRRPDPPRPAARHPPGRPADLPRGRLRQGRVGAPHAARAPRRRRLLRGRTRVPRGPPLREGRHRGLPRGAREGERPRPAPVLRALDLRDRPARAHVRGAHPGRGRRRLPDPRRRARGSPAGRDSAAGGARRLIRPRRKARRARPRTGAPSRSRRRSGRGGSC